MHRPLCSERNTSAEQEQLIVVRRVERVRGAGTPDASLDCMLERTILCCCLAAAACATEVAGDEGEFDDDGGDLGDIEASGLCDSTSGFISRRVDNPPGRPVARIELGSAPSARIRTNRGYRDISEANVDTLGNHWSSGCKGEFCVLYWQNSDGYFMEPANG
jgi:hypothetical protein